MMNRCAPYPQRSSPRVINGLEWMTLGRVSSCSKFFLEHDLFRKPVPTFRDHALTGLAAKNLVDRSDDHPGFFAGETVIDGLALASRGHQAVGAEPGKLLRNGRLS